MGIFNSISWKNWREHTVLSIGVAFFSPSPHWNSLLRVTVRRAMWNHACEAYMIQTRSQEVDWDNDERWYEAKYGMWREQRKYYGLLRAGEKKRLSIVDEWYKGWIRMLHGYLTEGKTSNSVYFSHCGKVKTVDMKSVCRHWKENGYCVLPRCRANPDKHPISLWKDCPEWKDGGDCSNIPRCQMRHDKEYARVCSHALTDKGCRGWKPRNKEMMKKLEEMLQETSTHLQKIGKDPSRESEKKGLSQMQSTLVKEINANKMACPFIHPHMGLRCSHSPRMNCDGCTAFECPQHYPHRQYDCEHCKKHLQRFQSRSAGVMPEEEWCVVPRAFAGRRDYPPPAYGEEAKDWWISGHINLREFCEQYVFSVDTLIDRARPNRGIPRIMRPRSYYTNHNYWRNEKATKGLVPVTLDFQGVPVLRPPDMMQQRYLLKESDIRNGKDIILNDAKQLASSKIKSTEEYKKILTKRADDIIERFSTLGKKWACNNKKDTCAFKEQHRKDYHPLEVCSACEKSYADCMNTKLWREKQQLLKSGDRPYGEIRNDRQVDRRWKKKSRMHCDQEDEMPLPGYYKDPETKTYKEFLVHTWNPDLASWDSRDVPGSTTERATQYFGRIIHVGSVERCHVKLYGEDAPVGLLPARIPKYYQRKFGCRKLKKECPERCMTEGSIVLLHRPNDLMHLFEICWKYSDDNIRELHRTNLAKEVGWNSECILTSLEYDTIIDQKDPTLVENRDLPGFVDERGVELVTFDAKEEKKDEKEEEVEDVIVTMEVVVVMRRGPREEREVVDMRNVAGITPPRDGSILACKRWKKGEYF